MSYIDMIKEKARLDKKAIVLPEAEDKRTLLAAAKILEEDIAKVVLVGNAEQIKADAAELQIDIAGATVIEPATSDKLKTLKTKVIYTR